MDSDKMVVSFNGLFDTCKDIEKDYEDDIDKIANDSDLNFFGLCQLKFRDYSPRQKILVLYDDVLSHLTINISNINGFFNIKMDDNEGYYKLNRDKDVLVARFVNMIDSVIQRNCGKIIEYIDMLDNYYENCFTLKPIKSCENPNFYIEISNECLTLIDSINDVYIRKSYYDDSIDYGYACRNGYNNDLSLSDYNKKIDLLLDNIYFDVDSLPFLCIKKLDKKLIDVIRKDEIVNINKENIKIIIGEINFLFEKLDLFSAIEGDFNRISISDEQLFRKNGDHLEIKDYYIPYLKYFDLSILSFDNVDVSGVDFSDTNMFMFSPQKVYRKDLSNCTFKSNSINNGIVPFEFFSNFNGVNLSGTTIVDDSPFGFYLRGAITDKNTNIIINKKKKQKVKKKNM